METTVKSPTLAEMIEASKQQAAQIEALKAQLASAGKAEMKIEAGIADYSKGTISIRGINRFPISLFAPQVPVVVEYLNSHEFKAFMANPNTLDRLRCAAVAHEFATGLGKEWPTGAKSDDPRVLEYKAAYDQGYKAAKADPKLVATPRAKKSASKVALAR